MKILVVQFDYPGKNAYERLLAVFAKSVEWRCPTAELVVERITAPLETKRNAGMTSNWHKFKVWNEFVQAQSDGERVVLMDADMLIIQDIEPAFDEAEFDIGLTRRTSTAWPYNGGVIFINVNERSRAFVSKWGEIDDEMYRDDSLHDPYKKRYKGQNQASLGWMVEHNPMGAVIHEFPCAVWNACNEDWMRFGPHTRVVHIKSTLRHSCLGRTSGHPSKMKAAYRSWKRVEDAL